MFECFFFCISYPSHKLNCLSDEQIKDAGGGDSVLGPATTSETARIDVNERIVSLERLNPTPRPTT